MKRFFAIFVFAIRTSIQGQTIEVLHTWPDSNQPWANKGPHAPLVQGTDGNFYGTTFSSGPPPWDSNETGTIFKMTPDGEVRTMATFSPTDGQDLNGLIQGSDGNFYGTAAQGGDLSGGPPGYGTVFSMTPGGVLTTLFQFDHSNGSRPMGTLVEGSDGSFYGVTGSGGLDDYGTVYSITSAGILNTLVGFNKTNGANPSAGLALGRDGNFYGTTTKGGARGYGTIFKIDPSGSLTTLYSFSSAATTGKIVNPNALVQGQEGTWYGTTQTGGIQGMGTIFKLSPDNVFTELYSFHGSDGNEPGAGLTMGRDGNFFGSTHDGGAAGRGVLFQWSPEGAFTILFSFEAQGLAYPGYPGKQAALIQGGDGRLYGFSFWTSAEGGESGMAVFRFTIPPPTLPPLKIVRSDDSVVLSWSATTIGAILEWSHELPARTWAAFPTDPVRIGDDFVVAVEIDSTSKFFRLRR
jgi:uncharacterized repeat protein (TIGR03803 family)